MGDYRTPEEMAHVLAGICGILPAYRIKVPLLSWDYKFSKGVDTLVILLRERGLSAEKYTGGYYDSYAEGDDDLCVVCGKDASAPIIEGEVSYDRHPEMFGDKPCRMTVVHSPDRCGFSSDDHPRPYDKDTQYAIYDLEYGRGNYKWMYETRERTEHDDGFSIWERRIEVPR